MDFSNIEEVSKCLKRFKERSGEVRYYDFGNCRFNIHIDWSTVIDEFDGEVNFQSAAFLQGVKFDGIIFQNKVNFIGCLFERNASFQKVTFEKEVFFGLIGSSANFSNAKFNGQCVFGFNDYNHSILFSNSVFENLLDFSKKTFKGNTWLNDCTFKRGANFEHCEFQGKLEAWEISCQSDLNFKWANFNQKVNLTDLKCSGKANFYGAKFEGNGYFYNGQFKNLDIDKTVIEKRLFFLGSEIRKITRESARIIKNEFLNQNNRIEALKYHQREMRVYTIELWKNLVKKKNLKKKPRIISDLFILGLNAISNGFGLLWSVGIIFYLVSTFLVFHWLWSVIPYYSELNYWVEYVKFLSPVHKMIEGESLPLSAYIIDALGRIVASFGIYQTVQAFRKYGKF